MGNIMEKIDTWLHRTIGYRGLFGALMVFGSTISLINASDIANEKVMGSLGQDQYGRLVATSGIGGGNIYENARLLGVVEKEERNTAINGIVIGCGIIAWGWWKYGRKTQNSS